MLAGASLVGSTNSSAAAVIAGWDSWNSLSTPTASVLTADVTGTAVTSGGWTNVENSNSGRGASSDGTWGSFVGPAAATTAITPNGNMSLTNGKVSGDFTFTITNNGLADIVLENFHFDAYAFRPNAARTYELSVLAGGAITSGVVFTSATDAITSIGGLTNTNHDEIDLDLSLLGGSADLTLEAGGSVQLLLAFSDGSGSGGGHHLFVDNVALSGTVAPIPEPSALGLAMIGALGFFIRRRR